LDTGIGRHLFLTGTALYAQAGMDEDLEREMSVLGAHLVVPVRSADQLLGMLILGPKTLGDPLTREQVDLVFLLMEDFGPILWQTQHNRKLHENLSVLQGTLASVPLGVLLVDDALTVLYSNPALSALLGSANGLLSFTDLPNLLASAIYTVLKAPQTALVVPLTVHSRQLEAKIRAQSPQRIFVSLSDMTDYHAQLASYRLSERQTCLKLLSQQISHVFNNKLVALATYHQLYLDDPVQGLPRLLAPIPETLTQLQRPIAQLHSLCQPAHAPENITLKPLIEEIWGKLPVTDKHSLVLPKAGTIRCPRVTLEAALFELLLNAVQARPGVVQVDCGSNTITVHDSGEGIPPNIQDSIASGLPCDSVRGLGLGLLLTHQLMLSAQGRLVLGKSPVTSGAALSLAFNCS
jgi:signal transduction histidine kinase